MRNCTWLYDKIEVFENHVYTYRQNGRSFIIRFVGLNKDPGQFTIESSSDSPLTADNITIMSNTTVPYSSNLFYEPIPFEMLKTYETKP